MAGRRDENRSHVQQALLTAARQELRSHGAAALSVRAVAREMGMAPSALFRYITGRDDLLTLLIVDAYDDLANHVTDAEVAVPRPDLRGRWRAIATSLRQWAVDHPHEYALLYGCPVPGFRARADETNRAGTRVPDLLAAIGREPAAAGGGRAGAGQLDRFAAASEFGDLPDALIVAGLAAWTILLGAVTAEVFSYLGLDLPYETTLFAKAVEVAQGLMFGDAALA